jgi:hypothetical protein
MLRRPRRMRKNRCRANPRQRSKLKEPSRRGRRPIVTVERCLGIACQFGTPPGWLVGDNGSRGRSLLWINVPPRRPRYEFVDFVQLRSRHVDLDAVTFSQRICGRCRCGFQRRFARDVPTDPFAVAKKRPSNRSLDDIVNVTSHRSPSLRNGNPCYRSLSDHRRSQ